MLDTPQTPLDHSRYPKALPGTLLTQPDNPQTVLDTPQTPFDTPLILLDTPLILPDTPLTLRYLPGTPMSSDPTRSYPSTLKVSGQVRPEWYLVESCGYQPRSKDYLRGSKGILWGLRGI
eukprot:sb/3476213/